MQSQYYMQAEHPEASLESVQSALQRLLRYMPLHQRLPFSCLLSCRLRSTQSFMLSPSGDIQKQALPPPPDKVPEESGLRYPHWHKAYVPMAYFLQFQCHAPWQSP